MYWVKQNNFPQLVLLLCTITKRVFVDKLLMSRLIFHCCLTYSILFNFCCHFCRYMVQGDRNGYPEGPTNVIPLLIELLPGIDPNDLRKSYVTFNFIVHFINMIPVINSSEANNYYELTEEEHIICEATANFEDFVLQFFDRLCVWMESNSLDFIRLEQIANNDNIKNKTEALTESALGSLIGVVLMQCSPEIFKVSNDWSRL